jgi:hypothetical protein
MVTSTTRLLFSVDLADGREARKVARYLAEKLATTAKTHSITEIVVTDEFGNEI